MSLRDFCIALLAGGVGVGGAVVVQPAAPPKPAVVKAKPRVARPATIEKSSIVAPAAPSAALLSDCPLPSADLGGLGMSTPVVGGNQNPIKSFHPAGFLPPVDPDWWNGGGGFGPLLPPPPTLPAVPEVSNWAIMIAGFGLIGLAMRRRQEGRA